MYAFVVFPLFFCTLISVAPLCVCDDTLGVCARTGPYLNGSVLIGGLFNIHEGGTVVQPCGPVVDEDAVQRWEAFLLAIRLLNEE